MNQVEFVKWGGGTGTFPADFSMGVGAYRNVPAYGVRRALWDAACGYASGFPVSAIVYFVVTRSLSDRICRWTLRREFGRDVHAGSIPLRRGQKIGATDD